jgi:hypothetical protein
MSESLVKRFGGVAVMVIVTLILLHYIAPASLKQYTGTV